ncbi:MAG: DUF3095 family protein, partial [Myxococcota bacterium]
MSVVPNSTMFFDSMESFSDFPELLLEHNYISVPSDWWVVITDVRGSTVAIEEGRYKEVNTVGAATLAAIQNAMGPIPFPFVFGGDGASALIPDAFREQVEVELSALRTVSHEQFGLELRVGLVSVVELESMGYPVRIAKFLLEGHYPQAIFRGGTLSKAEAMIKQSDRYEVPQHPKTQTDLRHLSCRWKPLRSAQGSIVSLLFVDPAARDDVYAEFFAGLSTILGGDVRTANPVNHTHMRYRSLSELLADDRRYQTSLLSRLPRFIDSMLATLLFGWGLFRWIEPLRTYVERTAAHSDFRKFDDMLRMILDCNPAQVENIQHLCQDMRQRYGVCYGLHLSEEALMTCYVPSFDEGQHIHFIDGG